MALIRKLDTKSPQTKSVHNEVEGAYFSLIDDLGNKYLQIESYGSPERKVKGKTSQAIQLDKTSAFQLYEILKQEFSFK